MLQRNFTSLIYMNGNVLHLSPGKYFGFYVTYTPVYGYLASSPIETREIFILVNVTES